MSETKHTPGPWTSRTLLTASENHRGFTVRDADGYMIAEVMPRDEDGIEGQSNARLVTAAPDLLKALKFYSDPCNFIMMDGKWYEYGSENIDLTQYLPMGAKAAAAIAKAEGRDTTSEVGSITSESFK